MKTLLILRHAKSSWDDPQLADFDRPLNPRGERDAPRMGQLLKEKQLIPDLILSSSALRAKLTTEKVVQASGYQGNVLLTEDLYNASPSTYVKKLNTLKDEHRSVLVVGHNPILEELLTALTGQRERLPTAALVWLKLPISSWKDLTLKTQTERQEIWRPKEL